MSKPSDGSEVRTLLETWEKRIHEIASTLDRCDSAKAREVMRCRDELSAALDVSCGGTHEEKEAGLPAVPEAAYRDVPDELPLSPAVALAHLQQVQHEHAALIAFVCVERDEARKELERATQRATEAEAARDALTAQLKQEQEKATHVSSTHTQKESTC